MLRVSLILAIVCCLYAGGPVQGREVPDLGLILNDDAGYSFRGKTLEESAEILHRNIDHFAEANIRTLVYSLGEGSDIMVYPTQVSSTWGWRVVPDEETSKLAAHIRRNREAIAQGGDAVRVAGERAKSHGMYFIPSLRMNDSHFAKKPLTNPLTGKFWLENQDLIIARSGESPVSDQRFKNLLDFSHEKVRNHRLQQAFEAIDRYADLMDGFELDFNRIQIFFPKGQAEQKQDLITDMVARVRDRLDELERQKSRSYYLIVRVPPSIESCTRAGLDVKTWIQKKLVDVVSPAQLMAMPYDMPIEPFVDAARGTGCKIYPSIYPRTGWRWPLVLDETEVGDPSRMASREQIRAAAVNLWYCGADGIYLFNYRKGVLDDTVYDIASAGSLVDKDKCFTVMKNYFLDREGVMEDIKQLPRDFNDGVVDDVQLLIGEDLSKSPTPAAIGVMRIGLQNAPENGGITIEINDSVLFTGDIAAVLRVPPAEKRALSKDPDLADQLLVIPAKALDLFRPGMNSVTVRLANAKSVTEPTVKLTDIELAVTYGSKSAVTRESR